jgi:hypothetical protein
MDAGWETRVRERAYAIWEREGRPEGGAEQHWAQAEAELRAEEGQGGGGSASTAGTETWTEPTGGVAEGGPGPGAEDDGRPS